MPLCPRIYNDFTCIQAGRCSLFFICVWMHNINAFFFHSLFIINKSCINLVWVWIHAYMYFFAERWAQSFQNNIRLKVSGYSLKSKEMRVWWILIFLSLFFWCFHRKIPWMWNIRGLGWLNWELKWFVYWGSENIPNLQTIACLFKVPQYVICNVLRRALFNLWYLSHYTFQQKLYVYWIKVLTKLNKYRL